MKWTGVHDYSERMVSPNGRLSVGNDVSAVRATVPCRLDMKLNLRTAAIFTICSAVSTDSLDRHKAREPCLVYQKHLSAKIIFFLDKPGLTERKISCI